MEIVLGVGGGIAAYKAALLLRLMTEAGHGVTVVPTANALEFVGAATWEALSGRPVRTDTFEAVDEVNHVRLGRRADLVVVAPATADLLARTAAGMAPDLLGNVLLTATCPVVLAPAMHTEMWHHPATVANVALLRERGVTVVDLGARTHYDPKTVYYLVKLLLERELVAKFTARETGEVSNYVVGRPFLAHNALWQAQQRAAGPSDVGTPTWVDLDTIASEWDDAPMTGEADEDEAGALAALARTVAASDGGVLLLVPDHRDLDRLCAALDEHVGEDAYARIGSEDGNTPRYRAHLAALRGTRRIVAGTRAAVWSPVRDLRLVVLWDDGDDAWAEPRAPYFHAREVVLERARATGAALLFAGPSRSVPVQRLVESGWLLHLGPSRAAQRELGPRVVSTADAWETARDPFAQRARLPQAAWAAARAALLGPRPGPVLVQVARAGSIPALVCERCRTPARCRVCAGPLGFRDARAARHGEVACRWCGTRERGFRCTECGGTTLRAGARGVDRTAEELGRAFPRVPVHASSAQHMLGSVPPGPSLVVATVGAEPMTPDGYAAALLLDGDSQLQREGLDVPGRVLARWLAAACLVRPASDGGVVVVTADAGEAVNALVRRDPDGFAARQVAERRELHLPPAGRLAEVTGEAAAVAEYLELVEAARRERPDEDVHEDPHSAPLDGGPARLPWIGPVPDPADETRSRALLIFPYAAAEATVGALRAARSAASARRETAPVRVRLDPAGVL